MILLLWWKIKIRNLKESASEQRKRDTDFDNRSSEQSMILVLCFYLLFIMYFMLAVLLSLSCFHVGKEIVRKCVEVAPRLPFCFVWQRVPSLPFCNLRLMQPFTHSISHVSCCSHSCLLMPGMNNSFLNYCRLDTF